MAQAELLQVSNKFIETLLFCNDLWYVSKVRVQNIKRDRKVLYMKKRSLALLLCMMMAVTAAACGNGEKKNAVDGTENVESDGTEETEGQKTASSEYTGARSSEFDLAYEDYVTLPDYSKIEVSISGDYEVEDSDVDDYITQMFEYYGPYYEADESKTVIEEGDIVDVDYVGKKDGVAFDGGSAENQIIDVSNNCSVKGSSYIEGFTDGLLGASVGDVVDCKVTFPEEYQSEELAGQEVVFTFTVNAIEKEITQDQMDDAFVEKNFGAESVSAMEEEVLSYLKDSAEYNKSNDTYTAIQDWLRENSKVEVPEDYLAARVSEYEYNFVQQNCSDGTSLEDYLSQTYGYTYDQAIELWTDYMKENVELEFILIAISQKEGLTLDEEEYAAYVSNLISNSSSAYGTTFEDEEALYDMYGMGDAAAGEEYLRRIYVANLALDELKEKATVNVVPAEESTEEPTEAAE